MTQWAAVKAHLPPIWKEIVNHEFRLEPKYSNALFSSEFLCDELVIICGTRFPAPLDFLIVPKESGIGILTIIRSILSARTYVILPRSRYIRWRRGDLRGNPCPLQLERQSKGIFLHCWPTTDIWRKITVIALVLRAFLSILINTQNTTPKQK